MDRKSSHARMSEEQPEKSAAAQFVHVAYRSYTVDDYLAKLGFNTKGEALGGQEHSD